MRKVTTQYIDKEYLEDRKWHRDVRQSINKDKDWLKLCIKNNTKDGKRHFTKIKRECSGCYDLLDMRDPYHSRYGFCSVGCGYTTFGLSASDFY